jgi:uncharacterized membrane protein
MSTKILGHYVHPILIVLPLGALTTSVIFDIVHLFTSNPEHARVAYWTMLVGIFGGVAAAPFGLVDWLGIPSGTRAKRVGLSHALATGGMMALFIASWLLRGGAPGEPSAIAVALSFLGLATGAVGGWLGGELVERLGIGVDRDAHVNAPSSLSGREARESAASTPPGGDFMSTQKPAH